MKRFKIDYSFLLIVLILCFSPKQYLIFKLLFCLCIHELGHLIFVVLLRYKIAHLKLSIFGFFMELDHVKEEAYKDLLIFSAGILMNLLCFLCIPDEDIRLFSFILLVVNILPIYPLDGFNILKTIASFFFPFYFVLKILSILSLVLSFFIILLSIYLKMDLFLNLNFAYLCMINVVLYSKTDIHYQKFLLNKTLYVYNYPVKRIHFHSNFQKFFYKYHTIEVAIGNKIVSQEELLSSRNVKN
ncbi:MAG: hypothetical protein K2P14_02235 [Anaeroplasmataceae bacterium]|jgi:Peptidase family M50.|nr:hypothetical protein [Anaeroplasmataceae bacterium]